MSTTSSTISFQSPNCSIFLITNEMTETEVTMSPDSQKPCVDYGSLNILLAVLYTIIFILGLIGNLVALWVFFCVHSKKNSVRVFLINVSFADLLLVICLPFRIIYHSQGDKWNLGPILCKAVGTLFYMNMYISITLLGLISIDRYLKIHGITGVQYRLQSRRWSNALCAVIWTVSFALTMVFMMSKNHSEMNRCFHYKLLDNAKWKAYINISLVVLFWLVFISLVASYVKIALKLLRTSHEKPGSPNAPHYARTARKSFFILFLFTICFVPYHIVRVFYIKTQIQDTSCYWQGVADKANEVALVFSALNSCLDPVMFFFLSSSVRKEVIRLMSNMCARDFTGDGASSSTVELDGKKEGTSRGLLNVSSTNNLKEKAVIESHPNRNVKEL